MRPEGAEQHQDEDGDGAEQRQPVPQEAAQRRVAGAAGRGGGQGGNRGIAGHGAAAYFSRRRGSATP